MDSNTLALGTVLNGKYRVTRLVAGGGMAWVYEVEELRSDGVRQIWAMKELRTDTEDAQQEESRRLFTQEAELLEQLKNPRHPNLPLIADFFAARNHLYLVMEFIHGESLEKRLQHASAPLLEGQVLDWGVQICEVLAYLHSRPAPIIFRDMKPSNVMVTLDGRIKLIDFGIARVYKKGKPKDTITMGSENYAAPEQWGKAQTDPRADIYSLGATLYHLLTNMPPLPAFVPTPRVAVQTYNPAVTDRTVAVIEKAMAEDPARRYTTALEMREALLACLPAPERRRLEARSAEAAARLRATATTATQAPAPIAATPTPAPRPAAPQPVVTTVSASPMAAPSPQYPTVGASAHPTPPGLAAQEYTKPCPRCATLNKPAARFCRACGYTFAPPLPPVLAVVEPLGARWEYPLRGNSVLIGRPGGRLPVDLDLDYYDTQDYVSRNHARVTMDQRRYYVTDVGSGNGTTVNDERLTPQLPRLLRSGDRIRLGQVVLQFRIR